MKENILCLYSSNHTENVESNIDMSFLHRPETTRYGE